MPIGPVTIAAGIELPPAILTRFYNFHGREKTDAWLETIPSRLDEWLGTWRIEIEHAEPPDTVNLVLFGHSQLVGDVVLKLCPPTFESLAEIAALRLAAGDQVVRLIDADPTTSVLMLERIRPGTDLKTFGLSDEESTRIGAEKLLAFWREPQPPDDLIPLERWARELLDYKPQKRPELPEDLLTTGVRIAHELLKTQTNQTLLHGDLHHQNILWGGDQGWVTIDPKGLIGDRGYDIATWMMNPWTFPRHEDFLVLANRRLDVFAEMLGEDRSRLAKWAVFHAALSLCWSLDVENPEDSQGDITFLRSMARLLD
jgi:streptomycin 6-kinase